MTKAKTKKKRYPFEHLLTAELDLKNRIEKAMKKHRPYMRSRNTFIIELILLGIESLDKK